MSAVEMTANHFATFVGRAHMKVCINGTVHRIDGPCQRNNFIASLKLICQVVFFAALKRTDSKIIYRPLRLHACELDILL